VEAAVGVAVETYGGLDAAIANAGVIAGGPHWESDLAAERAVLDIDLAGVLNLARVAVPVMLQRPEPRAGRFIAVASAAGERGLDKLAAYCAAKAGVLGFVRGLAADLGCTGVTANAVSPGSTATAALEATARMYGIDEADFANEQPMKRVLDVDEVAAAIAWLAGPESSGMTGAVVAVDGGLAV
jgi:SDR family mycofactocin-dependent oxidoreductase